MKLLEAITTYFAGEKLEALVFILPVGLLGLVFGGWLLSESAGGSFARGVAIPFVVMGLVMGVVGGVVGFRTPAQVAALTAAVEASPEQALRDERARMEKVNRAWPVYLVVWAAFGVTGLVLRFGTRGDFTQGLGISLVFFCGVCLLVDGFAERRARPYTAAIEAQPSPPSRP
ncbi:MAG: hypothetical protein RL653_1774 [Pseudomonadota bacterium]|jgi:hypothetical protein